MAPPPPPPARRSRRRERSRTTRPPVLGGVSLHEVEGFEAGIPISRLPAKAAVLHHRQDHIEAILLALDRDILVMLKGRIEERRGFGKYVAIAAVRQEDTQFHIITSPPFG